MLSAAPAPPMAAAMAANSVTATCMAARLPSMFCFMCRAALAPARFSRDQDLEPGDGDGRQGDFIAGKHAVEEHHRRHDAQFDDSHVRVYSVAYRGLKGTPTISHTVLGRCFNNCSMRSAACDGCRWPCSQLCTVFVETLSTPAKTACDMPILSPAASLRPCRSAADVGEPVPSATSVHPWRAVFLRRARLSAEQQTDIAIVCLLPLPFLSTVVSPYGLSRPPAACTPAQALEGPFFPSGSNHPFRPCHTRPASEIDRPREHEGR